MTPVDANTSRALAGVVPALLTPFAADGTVDGSGLAALVRHVASAGVHGLHPCGTTGEAPLLGADERKRVLEIVLDANEAALPVIAQVGHLDPAVAVALARHAADIGADAVSVVTPYYYRLPDGALYDYYLQVARAVPPELPVYLYNIPQNTGNAVTPDLLHRVMREAPHVRGLKHSQPDLDVLAAFLALEAPSPEIWVGNDGHVLPGLALGAVGVVSGNANVAPELVVALHRAVVSGDLQRARQLQNELRSLASLLGSGGNLAAMKAAAAERGVPMRPDVRSPLAPLAGAGAEAARQAALRASAFAA